VSTDFEFDLEKYETHIDKVVEAAYDYWIKHPFQRYESNLNDGEGVQVFKRALTATDAVICVLLIKEGGRPLPELFRWEAVPVWPVAERRLRERIPNYDVAIECRQALALRKYT
jgi:hypothetical protein